MVIMMSDFECRWSLARLAICMLQLATLSYLTVKPISGHFNILSGSILLHLTVTLHQALISHISIF